MEYGATREELEIVLAVDDAIQEMAADRDRKTQAEKERQKAAAQNGNRTLH